MIFFFYSMIKGHIQSLCSMETLPVVYETHQYSISLNIVIKQQPSVHQICGKLWLIWSIQGKATWDELDLLSQLISSGTLAGASTLRICAVDFIRHLEVYDGFIQHSDESKNVHLKIFKNFTMVWIISFIIISCFFFSNSPHFITVTVSDSPSVSNFCWI